MTASCATDLAIMQVIVHKKNFIKRISTQMVFVSIEVSNKIVIIIKDVVHIILHPTAGEGTQKEIEIEAEGQIADAAETIEI